MGKEKERETVCECVGGGVCFLSYPQSGFDFF